MLCKAEVRRCTWWQDATAARGSVRGPSAGMLTSPGFSNFTAHKPSRGFRAQHATAVEPLAEALHPEKALMAYAHFAGIEARLGPLPHATM